MTKKISESIRYEIRELIKQKVSTDWISNEFKISRMTISRILREPDDGKSSIQRIKDLENELTTIKMRVTLLENPKESPQNELMSFQRNQLEFNQNIKTEIDDMKNKLWDLKNALEVILQKF